MNIRVRAQVLLNLSLLRMAFEQSKLRAYFHAVVILICAVLIISPRLAIGEQSSVLEEVVVTAQRREQSLQDVSVSITVFTGNELVSLGYLQPKDLAAQTPGLMIKNTMGDTSPIIVIRGIGLNDFMSNNNPTASVYVNHVILPFHPMLSFSLFDIERVEVLKGPQGTLYGRNNTGGAINFITRRPTQEFDGFVRADYSRFDTFDFEGAIGGGLTDTLTARISIMTRQRGKGTQRNITTGERQGEQDRLAARILLNWTPIDSIDILLDIHGGRDDSDNYSFKAVPTRDPANPYISCSAVVVGQRVHDGSCTDITGFYDPSSNPHEVTGTNAAFGGDFIDNSTWGTSAIIDWELARMILTSVTGYESFDRAEASDPDGNPLILEDNSYNDDIWAVSQEVRLTSDKSWPFNWILGAFYSKDKIHVGQTIRTDGMFDFFLGLPAPSQAAMNAVQKSEAIAGFVHFDWAFTERWQLIGGLRQTHEEKSFVGGTILTSDPLTPIIGPIIVNMTDDSIATDDLSGKIGIDFFPNDNWLIYANISKGFKSGGYNSTFASSPIQLEPFDPETLWAFESGFKANLLDGRMRLNSALYYYKWQDFQAPIIAVDPTGVPVQILTNAGDAEVIGIEAEMLWRPVDAFDIKLGLNWNDTEVLSGQFKGMTLANTPEFTLNGLVRYIQPLQQSGVNLIIQSDFNYQSSMKFRLANPAPLLDYQNGYWLANARLSITAMDDKWEVAIWVRNISDKDYLTEVFDQPGFNSLDMWAVPRTYGVSMSYWFF